VVLQFGGAKHISLWLDEWPWSRQKTKWQLEEWKKKAVVGIHKVHWENKWMGSSDFGDLNKTTSRTAGWGLK